MGLIEIATREAEQNRWAEAIEAYAEADAGGEGLTGSDLFSWGMATYWRRDVDGAIDLLKRSASRCRADGDLVQEARTLQSMIQIASVAGRNVVVAAGAAQLQVVLEELPEGEAHAIREWAIGALVLHDDIDEGVRRLEAALVTARRVGSPSAESLVLTSLSQADAAEGRAGEAMRKVDAAAALALSSDVGHLIAGGVLCGIVWSCRTVGDWDRAASWTEVATRWADRTAVSYYPGLCSFHRCEVMRVQGRLAEAETQAIQACEELAGVMTADNSIGHGYRELGYIRLLRGDDDGAREAFRLAAEHGVDPNPGLALLRLRHGEVASARRALEDALDAPRANLEVPFLLPALVTAYIAAEDLDAAERALARLVEIAEQVGVGAHSAAAAQAEAELALARGDDDAVRRAALAAARRWNAVGAPYEAAHARELLAEVAHHRGDHVDALFELEGAKSTYERVGALFDAHRVTDRLAEMAALRSSPSEQKQAPSDRAFMFTDIVGSTQLQTALGDDRWMTLLGWHDRILRGVFDQHDGEIVKHEGDGFFVAFPNGATALRAACKVQARLAEHRETTGFAPDVRIGVHQGLAHPSQGDWFGFAVTLAARVAASAGAGEVVCTDNVVRSVPQAQVVEMRSIAAKGIDEPISVHVVASCS